ncbi:MAG: lipid-A-disaccharide synthase [Gammaproteobacteria bacterium]|nr:lipid-A-disaccharide synthase [Gammaproteobacteria bacterium]
MTSVKRLVIVAGEASGDQHAAKMLNELRLRYPDNYEVAAIGGNYLAQAGAFLIHDLAQYGVTGITEVLRHAFQIRQAFKKIKAYLTEHPPDLLILVDYPGFNLRLAKFAKSVLNLKILYYISPQVWAWKANRVQFIHQYIDHMAVILPFEKQIYTQAGVPCSFVGHPLLEHLPTDTMEQARAALGLPQHLPLIAFLPGSRQHEVKQLLPILIQAAHRLKKQFPSIHFVLPVANTIKRSLIDSMLQGHALPITLLTEQAPLVMSACDAVVVASGTASLECALLEKPMCIIYRTSAITYYVAMRVMKVKYLGLCNVIANKMIVPELMQADCTAAHISDIISSYLTDPSVRENTIQRLHAMKLSLSQTHADCDICDIVHEILIKNEKKLD